jgi:dTDP-4-amino-4,6-dideoxygalactose transaminase
MIAKSAINRQSFLNNLVFTSNARAAWEHILFSMKNASIQPNVLMPSYIGYTDREGSGVFDPVEAQNADAGFYKLNEDLSIDIDNFKMLVATKKFNAALIIHYFGFCRNDMEDIKSICKENNIILVEDCAHAFHLHEKESLLGKYGDFSFYSLHKYLPTTSGGVLKSNTSVVINSSLPEEKRINQQDLEHYAMSDFNMIAQKRRANYEIYENNIGQFSDVKIMYKLEEGDIPQTFPILIKNRKREKLYFYLMEREAPTTALYYRLISQINSEKFPLSHEISHEILNLPVHQDTNEKDVLFICDLIKDFFENDMSTVI